MSNDVPIVALLTTKLNEERAIYNKEKEELEKNPLYQDLIKKTKDPDMKSTLTNALEYHRRLAQGARDHYAKHRAKATMGLNLDCDMDMAIDASGGAGTCNFPHYAAAAKDDPARHKLLDIKCTFTKIHGFGTKVYISFPSLETQGGNLTVEVISPMIFKLKFI
jgi:hypothetical protein